MIFMLTKIAPYWKALAGGLAGGLSALAAVIPDGVTAAEWVNVALGVLAGAGIVYVAPRNRPQV